MDDDIVRSSRRREAYVHRKTHMNSKKINELKKTLKLTDTQRSILMGTMLGDGHLETQNGGRTYRLKVEHQLAQRDYTEWLHGCFQAWIPGGIYEKQKANGKQYVGFTTYSHGAFRFYAGQFYKTGKKVIPAMISKMLDPLVLAVWFMDDGSWKSDRHSTYLIHTLGFTEADLKRVKEVLMEKFHIETSLHRQKEKYWRLYIASKSAADFRQIIAPYIDPIASMQHKLGNTTMPKK
jgi:hypothetical protein